MATTRRLPPLLFLAGAAALGCRERPHPPAADTGPPAVAVAVPLFKPVTAYTGLTGNTAATRTADIRAQVSGIIKQVFFVDGDEVPAGALLLQIDPRPFDAALAKSEADKLNTVAQSELAKANADRERSLKASGRQAITAQEFDQYMAAEKTAAANVLAAAAALETAKLNREYCDVRTEFAGRLDRIYVDKGNVVTGGTGAGTVLTRINAVDPIYAYFNVDEGTVLEYVRRMNARPTAPAAVIGGAYLAVVVPVEIRLQDDPPGEYPFRGVIDFVSNEIDPSTGSLQVRGVFPNPVPGPGLQRVLRPGFFVRGRIPVKTPGPVVLVPDEAVGSDQSGKVVYVVGPDNKVAAKKVTLGPLSDGLRVIASGLSPDDRVVVSGLQRVQPGTVVDPQPGEIRPKVDKPAQPPLTVTNTK